MTFFEWLKKDLVDSNRYALVRTRGLEVEVLATSSLQAETTKRLEEVTEWGEYLVLDGRRIPSVCILDRRLIKGAKISRKQDAGVGLIGNVPRPYQGGYPY